MFPANTGVLFKIPSLSNVTWWESSGVVRNATPLRHMIIIHHLLSFYFYFLNLLLFLIVVLPRHQCLASPCRQTGVKSSRESVHQSYLGSRYNRENEGERMRMRMRVHQPHSITGIGI